MPAGFLDVSTQPPPGWSADVKTTKLAKPVQTDDGPVDTQVSEVDFTAKSGARHPGRPVRELPDVGRHPRQARPGS